MKWSGSNEMKDSFNCVTHPHSTSCARPSPSPVGMDIGMNRWRTVWFVEWFYQFFTRLQTQPPSNTVLAHKHAHKDSFRLQMNPVAKRQSMRPYRRPQTPLALVRVQMSATHPKTKIPTCAIHYLWHREKDKKKHKADSEMPPRDFLEELIYSI